MEYDIFVSDSYKKSALSRTDHCTWYLSTAFIEKYDLTIRPAKRQILLGGGTVYLYGSDSNLSSHSTIRHAYELRVAVERTTVWPGEYVEVSIPTDMSSLDGSFALEVHVDASSVQHEKSSWIWPPSGIISKIDQCTEGPEEERTVLSNTSCCFTDS